MLSARSRHLDDYPHIRRVGIRTNVIAADLDTTGTLRPPVSRSSSHPVALSRGHSEDLPYQHRLRIFQSSKDLQHLYQHILPRNANPAALHPSRNRALQWLAGQSPAMTLAPALTHLIEKNAERWRAMRVRSQLIHTFDEIAEALCKDSAKARYLNVQDQTGVPWWVIGVIHEREASMSWQANLAQGDPWDKVSTHVPRHQGPFKSWEDAACNALMRSPPYASHWSDWSPGGTATLLEQYNGLGYANRGLPSPYCWAGSTQYVRGKYVADGHFDPHAIDHQLGCMPLISRMMLIDKSVNFK